MTAQMPEPAEAPSVEIASSVEHSLSKSAPLDDALDGALGELRRQARLGSLKMEFADELTQRGALFEHVSTQANLQQDWFWSRFGAFASLHAGLLVFARLASGHLVEVVLAAGGTLLAALWWAVQSKSRTYVQNSKLRLRKLEALQGLRSLDESEGSGFHSTDYGVWTARIVFLVWALSLAVEAVRTAP